MRTKEEIIKVLKRFLTKGIGGYYYTFSTIEQIADALHQKEQEGMSAEELEDMFFSFIRGNHLRKKWEEFLDQYAKLPKTK